MRSNPGRARDGGYRATIKSARDESFRRTILSIASMRVLEVGMVRCGVSVCMCVSVYGRLYVCVDTIYAAGRCLVVRIFG